MRILPTLAAIALVASAAHAADARQSQIEVSAPWSRPAAAGMNGAGYMTLANRGRTADRLTAVESPVAKRVEIHRSTMTNGVMSMQRLDDGVAIGAGRSVAFAPGGNHVMFIGLTQALKTGDKAPATLVFQSGARAKVEFEVRTGPSAGAQAHH